jgi:HD-like signal output (HDOD) protein
MSLAQILARLESLPPFPEVAARLLRTCQDPDVDLAVVAALLERDPAMAANVLRVCNAPYFGSQGRVASVRHATTLLGIRNVLQITMTVLSSGHLASPQVGYGLGPGDLWRTSVASALAAELVAQEVSYPQVETAYTVGLLQDVGKIVLAEFVENAAEAIQALLADGAAWQEAEARALGTTHPEVGARLLSRWGFPAAIVDAVRTHHRPSEATVDPTLAAISHLADALKMTLGVGLGADGLAYELDEGALGALGLAEPSRLEGLVAELGRRMSGAQEWFGAAGAGR